MPKPKKTAVEARPILYPDLEVKLCDSEHLGPITVQQAKELLGWETEAEYKTRVTKDNPKIKAEQAMFSKDFPPLLKDETGDKVRCWNNSKNRPFSEPWSRQLAQDILMKNWAGPLCMPGETVNGETIVIGRSGQVESGQHRLVGLILASEIRAKNLAKWQANWPTDPVLESVVVLGVSESSKVLGTLDNVKPRTLSDIFYTSDLFDALGFSERRECSKMLERATGFLWARTGAGKVGESINYQTHSESTSFVGRHHKLLECIKHIFEENQERVITLLKLSPGQCAGAMYLMGCSKSDGDTYRNSDPPTEKKLDWENWDKACEFWTLIGSGVDFQPVRNAIGSLLDEDGIVGGGGRQTEKFCILAKAWTLFSAGTKMTEDDLKLETHTDDNGAEHLTEWPDFEGIDLGPKRGKEAVIDPPEPTPEEVEATKAAIRKEAAERAKTLAATKTSPSSPKKIDGKPPAPKLLKTPANKKPTPKPAPVAAVS